MNTLVGMQASLHQSIGEDIGELMKNNDDPLMIDSYNSEVHDLFDGDDFDAEEFLHNSLFNGSSRTNMNMLNSGSNNSNANLAFQMQQSRLDEDMLQHDHSFGDDDDDDDDFACDDFVMSIDNNNTSMGGVKMSDLALVSDSSSEFAGSNSSSQDGNIYHHNQHIQHNQFQSFNNNNTTNTSMQCNSPPQMNTFNQLQMMQTGLNNSSCSPGSNNLSTPFASLHQHSMLSTNNNNNNVTSSPLKTMSASATSNTNAGMNFTLAQMQQAVARTVSLEHQQLQQQQQQQLQQQQQQFHSQHQTSYLDTSGMSMNSNHNLSSATFSTPSRMEFQRAPPQRSVSAYASVTSHHFNGINNSIHNTNNNIINGNNNTNNNNAISLSPTFQVTPERSISYNPQLGKMNQLQQMQLHQQQQQQQQQQQRLQSNSFGISQSMHSNVNAASVATNTLSTPSLCLNQNSNGLNLVTPSRPNNLIGSASFHATNSSNAGASFNTSLLNGNNLVGGAADNNSSDNSPATLNEAMEKLCKSMHRSAMSRSMVKQISNGQGSGMVPASMPTLPRQAPMRQTSGHVVGVGRQLSSNNVGSNMLVAASSAVSSNNTMPLVASLSSDSGRGSPNSPAVPIRHYANAKHHLQHPQSRGVNRHDSQQSMTGASNHGGGMNLHVDGRNLGTF